MNDEPGPVRQVADQTGLSEPKVREAINKGHLPAKRIGASIRVRPQDLDTWVNALENVTN